MLVGKREHGKVDRVELFFCLFLGILRLVRDRLFHPLAPPHRALSGRHRGRRWLGVAAQQQPV
jgi:hypothetical protein